MRKVFLSLVALVAIPAALTAAQTKISYIVGDTATKYSWVDPSEHANLQIDANISIAATHDSKAKYTNGTYSNNQW